MKIKLLIAAIFLAMFFLYRKNQIGHSSSDQITIDKTENVNDIEPSAQPQGNGQQGGDKISGDISKSMEPAKVRVVVNQPNADFLEVGIASVKDVVKQKIEDPEADMPVDSPYRFANAIEIIEKKNGLDLDNEFATLAEPEDDVWLGGLKWPFLSEEDNIELHLQWDHENAQLSLFSCFFSVETGIKMYKNKNLRLKMGKFGYALLFLAPNHYVRIKVTHRHSAGLVGKIYSRTSSGWKELKKFKAKEILRGDPLTLKHCAKARNS